MKMSNSNLSQSDVKYVPIMGGEWNWYKDCYEPLTIVTHKGTFYISTTFVPYHADIEDTTYWTKIG